MRLRLLAVGIVVATGACDARSTEPSWASLPDLPDAAAMPPESPPLDAALVEPASPASSTLPGDAARLIDAGPTHTTPERDAAQFADAPPPVDARASWPLGMNDVTILTPRPAAMSSPVLLRGTDLAEDGAPLVPRDLFDRLEDEACLRYRGYEICEGQIALFSPMDYERLHLVAVRFDLCDRNLPGECAEGEDGRLRLVWQPLQNDSWFGDAALHAFCSIPSAELPSALTTLRELARMQAAPVSAPLSVSPGLSDPLKQAAYAERLRAFVRKHAQRARLVRFSVMAQPQTSQVRWLMRGLERRADGVFHSIVVPGSTHVQQDLFARGLGFEATPQIDLPSGLTGIMTPSMFEAASRETQTAMLEALLAVDHPLKVAPDTAPCAACHTSTTLLDSREAAVDVLPLRGGYVSSYDLSINTGMTPRERGSVRALGYSRDRLFISRRVIHETAQVLTEIERRFP